MEEVDLVVKSILDKVLNLRSAHDERTKTIRELTGDIEELERERTALLESVRDKMGLLEPRHKEFKVVAIAIYIMFNMLKELKDYLLPFTHKKADNFIGPDGANLRRYLLMQHFPLVHSLFTSDICCKYHLPH